MTYEATVVILNLISLMIRMTPIFICLKPRYGTHENIAAVSVYVWTLMISAQSLFHIPDNQFAIFQGVFSAVFFIVLMIYFEGAFSLKVFFYFSAWFATELLTSLNLVLGYLLRAQNEARYEHIGLILYIAALVAYFLLVKYYLKERTLKLFDEISRNGSMLVMSMPVMFLILLSLGKHTVFDEDSLKQEGLPTLMFYLGFCLVMLIIYLLTISDTLRAIDQRTAAEQLTAARQIISLKRKNYRQFLDYQQEIRIIKHDFSHHVHALQHMTDDERLKYLSELEEQLEQKSDLIFCDNESINALLQEYKTRAGEEEVRFDIDISIDKELPADNLAICIILGNLLENAIEACVKCEGERFIHLQMKSEDSGLRIMVKNSYNGKVKTYDKKLLSTKKNGGLGMLSIRRLLDPQNDDFDLYYDENVFVSMVHLSSQRQDPRG